jgi:hypothetical protein
MAEENQGQKRDPKRDTKKNGKNGGYTIPVQMS